MDIPPDKLEICLEILQQISEDTSVIDRHERMKALIAKIHREGKRAERRAARENTQAEVRNLQADTAIVASQRNGLPAALPPVEVEVSYRTLSRPNRCYICKTLYSELHFFYHLLCPECAAFNYARRGQTADLRGRTALITGGRIKIGFCTALKLLRDGARVLLTTRFPRDAAGRFRLEPDFCAWQDRLRIYPLDLRNFPAVEAFADHLLETETSLDILINNAAQTIKRPPEFYRAVRERESMLCDTLPVEARRLILDEMADSRLLQSTQDEPGALRLLPMNGLAEELDADGQPIDRRSVNSWSLTLDEVGSVEMLEVQLVNVIAPFMLNSRLKPLLLRSPFARRFIVNVSAMEGQFQRENKTWNHPHTNMAKAGLNMMTRTSASDYARDGIYMNSVDTGWITDENPYDKKTHLQEANGFYTPLDVVDAAARIYDPIARGIEDPAEPLFGRFLKDYSPCPW